MILNGLRQIASLMLTLASFFLGPAIMLAVCLGVMAIATFTQFLFLLPLLVPFLLPPLAIWMCMSSVVEKGHSSRPIAVQDSINQGVALG